MRSGSNAFRCVATRLMTGTPSRVGNRIASVNLAMLFAALMLFGGLVPGYAQENQPGILRAAPVLHVSITRPSSAPPAVNQEHGPLLSRTTAQLNLTPVNTGPGIVYTCDASVAAATCNYLNTTVAGYYNATFTNANANVYVTYGNTSLGASVQPIQLAKYSDYATAYGNIANKSAIQVSAQSALSTYDVTPYGSGNVWLTGALLTALGFSGVAGVTTAPAICTLGTTGCYNAIVTITNDPGITLYYDNLGGSEPAGAYDFYAVVEHETDEVLGTSSCVSTQANPLSDSCGTGVPSAVDLFRYSSAGHLILDSSLSTTPGAYFSYNGGSTNGAPGDGGTGKLYNTLDNGDDYADYVPSSPNCATNQALQDESGCPGADGGLTIFNDGGSEINILTAVGYGVPASALPCSSPNPNSNPDPESFAAPVDFNGDCKSDILWRNSTSGLVYIWEMSGGAVTSQVSPGTATTDWVIQGVGDFNGDGHADILWRNSTSGLVYIWEMNGGAITSQVSPGSATTDWVIQAVGDFNGDGKADILWRNSTSGLVYIWEMSGGAITSQISPGSATTDWVIQGVGDFNGDGKADILWRNSTSGLVYIWEMNGGAITSQVSPGSATTDWVIQAVGDFNGDGKSDILWRNSTSGLVYIWEMNGGAVTSQVSPGSATTDWVIKGVGDFNGDGKADILWSNSTSGVVYIWEMNGGAIASQVSPGSAASPWQIVSP